jgi:hypothetical protein
VAIDPQHGVEIIDIRDSASQNAYQEINAMRANS